jgi:proteic killer suppression protein
MKVRVKDEYLGMLVANKNKGKQKYPEEVEVAFKKRISQIKHVQDSQELRQIKSLHFEKLKEKRYSGYYSIRINKSYRMIFGLTKNNGLEVMDIEEINNHYT